MFTGRTKIASGVDGVGMIVAVGWGVCDGTTVGAVISVEGAPHALRMAMIKIAKKRCLTRKVILQKLRMPELYCLILRIQACENLNQKETHSIRVSF